MSTAQTVHSADEIPEEARKRLIQSKMVGASFGGVVAVLMRSPEFRNVFLADLEWLVLPALAHRQFALAEGQDKRTGAVAPVAVVLWAMVSPEVDQRISAKLDGPIRLAPNEWRSGDIPWIVASVGSREALASLLRNLAQTKFNTPAKLRVVDAQGRIAVGSLSPRSEPAA